ncbi:hypothetical protein ACYULU_05600 [Breznakiellaceae bacterium SP9]
MRTLQDYMDTPEIAGEPLYLREVHAARLKIHDETRDLAPAEWLDYWKQREQELIKEYDIVPVTI